MGYETNTSITNLGALTIFWAFWLSKLFVLIILKIRRLPFGNIRKHEKLYRYMMKSVFW